MQILDSPSALKSLSRAWRHAGLRVALVPTMGFFHAGHMSLMRHAATLADKVIVSRFLNPTQFAPNEDLASYPCDKAQDIRLAMEAGVDALFQPNPEAMYRPDHATWVDVPDLAGVMCGATRPTHFRGVCTVVLKLLHIVEPHMAVFGEKDWQQLAIIRRMVRDLDLDIRIEGHPIVREFDGLALSSRNAYLSPEERTQAPGIRAAILNLCDLVRLGERNVVLLQKSLQDDLARHVPLGQPDYLSIVHPETLQPLTMLDNSALVAVAVRLGKARLIDNQLLPLNS